MTLYLNFEIYLMVMPKEFYELQMVQIVGYKFNHAQSYG